MKRLFTIMCTVVLVSSGRHVSKLSPLEAEPTDSSFEDWAKMRANLLNEDLAPVGEIADRAQLLGLGEGDHARHEFAFFRNKVFSKLMREHGYTAIVLESGAVESSIPNSYVNQSNQIDPVALLLNGLTNNMGFWTETVKRKIVSSTRPPSSGNPVIEFDYRNVTYRDAAGRPDFSAFNAIMYFNRVGMARFVNDPTPLPDMFSDLAEEMEPILEKMREVFPSP